MPDIGVPELLIVAVIIVLLFGPGKAADLGGALGKSIREFRKASSEDDPTPPQQPMAARTTQRACGSCGTSASEGAKYCANCGASLALETPDVHASA